jgi:hypothetical protein
MIPHASPSLRAIALATVFLAACAPSSPATDRAQTPDSLAVPPSLAVTPTDGDFAEGTINTVAFEGSYACDPGFAPQITFSDDGTDKVFSAYLDNRLLTSGGWSWDGTTLHIDSQGGTFNFTDIDIGDGTLTLGRGESQWVCRNLPDDAP